MRRKWLTWLILLAGLAVLAGYGIMTYQSSFAREQMPPRCPPWPAIK